MNDQERGRRKRAVITGLGATTPLGGDVDSTWQAMLRGESGIRLLGEEWPGLLPPLPAGVVRVDPGPALQPKARRRLSRCGQLAVTAAAEAWRDAGFDRVPVPSHRVAVVVSSALGDLSTVVEAWEALKNKGWQKVRPMTAPMAMGNSAAAEVGILINARGGVHATVNACSSGTQALATALQLINHDLADVVVAGGADAPLHPVVLGSFASMRALSQRIDDPGAASRPFDVERDGVVLSEGAGMLVLESQAHAVGRGAHIYAELAGAGVSSDAYHMVLPEPNGAGCMWAIRASLDDAGVTPEQVAFVNANGTSTPAADAAEGRAVQEIFAEQERKPMLTAAKSMLGHSLGAAGAIESIATVLSLYHGVVPPTRNFTSLDEGLSIDVVHGRPRKLNDERVTALKNSFGFGGHNVALTFHGIRAATTS